MNSFSVDNVTLSYSSIHCIILYWTLDCTETCATLQNKYTDLSQYDATTMITIIVNHKPLHCISTTYINVIPSEIIATGNYYTRCTYQRAYKINLTIKNNVKLCCNMVYG